MNVGEWIACLSVLLLSLYGCVQLIRRLFLLSTRCGRMVTFYRLAVPQSMGALEPLLRCLQAQHAWQEDPCRCTLVLLPELNDEEAMLAQWLVCEDSSVVPMTMNELTTFIEQMH